MEQVFDLREFIIKMFKKFKLAIILGIVFGILGAAFGYIKYPDGDLIKTTSSASISFEDERQDATALTNATTNINSIITYDTFFYGILQQLTTELSQEELEDIFDGDTTPKIDEVKDIISVYVKGSVVMADVTCMNQELSAKASKICIDYAIEEIPSFFVGTTVKFLKSQSVNMTKQNNDSRVKEVVKFGVLGLGGGIVLALFIIFFVEIIDLRVKSSDDLKRFGLPVLAELE